MGAHCQYKQSWKQLHNVKSFFHMWNKLSKYSWFRKLFVIAIVYIIANSKHLRYHPNPSVDILCKYILQIISSPGNTAMTPLKQWYYSWFKKIQVVLVNNELKHTYATSCCHLNRYDFCMLHAIVNINLKCYCEVKFLQSD